jgi:urocanate hydratase
MEVGQGPNWVCSGKEKKDFSKSEKIILEILFGNKKLSTLFILL